MSDVFISYARSTAPQAQAVAEALRALGYDVWRDDELPAHRAYGEVIEERSLFAAPHESSYGTFETSSDVRDPVAIGG